MQITRVTTQLRTTDLEAAIRFYTEVLGFKLVFTYDDFYAGVRVGAHAIHLKLVDERDPSIAHVEHGDHFHLYLDVDDVAGASEVLRRQGVPLVRGVHDTDWGTREVILRDPDGHTIYLAQPR
jgi:catechol 2,3-dioxygenase-like lactoylglutathione lyase family enzyme